MLKYLVFRLQRIDWSIRRKMGLAFMIILLGMIVNGFISIFLLNYISTTDEQSTKYVSYLQQEQLYAMAYKGEQSIYYSAIFIVPVSRVNDPFREIIINNFHTNLNKDASKVDRQFEKDLGGQYDTVFDHFSAIDTSLATGDPDNTRTLWRNFQPDFTKVTTFLTDKENSLNAAIADSAKTISTTIFVSIATIIGTTLLSIGLALLMLFFIEKVIIQPLNKLQQALARTAEGNLEQQLDIPNRDEIGKLYASFRQALLSLQKVFRSVQISEDLRNVTQEADLLIKRVQASSNGALSQVNEGQNEVSSILQDNTDLRQNLYDLEDSAGQVKQSIVSLWDFAEQVRNQANEIKENTRQQRITNQQVVISAQLVENVAEQTSESTKQIATNSIELAHMADLLNSVMSQVKLG